ncbi:MAG: MFS transporter [Dehalococcoidales bacterium]|nr:MFS transporter [Dehalococcoidales bacterium]
MNLQNILQPRTTLSRDEVGQGLRALTWEGIASTGFSSLTASTFLAAFALALGASSFQIGLLASIPFITDLFQIPAVWLIEGCRRRKVVVLATWLASLLLWVPIALIPVVMEIPSAGAISILLGLMAVRGIFNALTNCAWSSWMRDLVPRQVLGQFFARRLSLSTAVAVVLALAAAFVLDHCGKTGNVAIGYTFVVLTGLVFFGLVSPAITAFIPEPMMPQVSSQRHSLVDTVAAPLREKKYRQLMKLLMFWGFATNLAIPFFSVFMLRQLGLSILTVVALTTVSEVFIVLSLGFWGSLADRFGSKTALSLSASLFLLIIPGWVLTAVAGINACLILILAVLHVFSGIAVAGITLTTGTLALKLAPQGRATSCLAGASLADSAGTGVGALAGGFLADVFAGRTVVLNLHWADLPQSVGLDSVELTGFHFLFSLACVIGFMALRTLRSVQETGASEQRDVLEFFVTKSCRAFRLASPIAEPSSLGITPASYWTRVTAADIGKGIADYHLAAVAVLARQTVSKTMRGLQKKPPSWEVKRRSSHSLKLAATD